MLALKARVGWTWGAAHINQQVLYLEKGAGAAWLGLKWALNNQA